MKRLLTSCFGLGLLPFAPGTWGSIPPAVMFDLLGYLGWKPINIGLVMIAFILTGGFICVRFAPAVIASTGKKDPREVVADELAGQAVTFLCIVPFLSAFTTDQFCITTALGFLLFRLFDISKPWPIRKLEKFPTGWGILFDDLLAGIYAGIGLLIFSVYIYPNLPRL